MQLVVVIILEFFGRELLQNIQSLIEPQGKFPPGRHASVTHRVIFMYHMVRLVDSLHRIASHLIEARDLLLNFFHLLISRYLFGTWSEQQNAEV